MDAIGDKTMRRIIGKSRVCGNPSAMAKAELADGGYIMKFFTAAVLMPFGKGCQAGNGRVPTIGGVGTTTLGNNSFALTVTNPPTNSRLAVLLVGTSRLTGPSGALPIDLGPTGARGCWQNASAAAIQFVPFTGNLNFPAPIPNDPKLKGIDVFAQFAVDDPTRALFATTQGGLLHLQ